MVCGTWTIRREIAGSLPLDANGLHHLAPLLGFFADEFGEIGRRPWKSGGAQLGKPCGEFGADIDRIRQ